MDETVAPAASRKRKSGEHRSSPLARSRIVDATLAVAREHGYNGLTIARVSQVSGMPAGSVYWHFASKDHLLLAALELSFERHLRALKTLAPQPQEGVHTFIDRLVSQMRNNDEPWEFWRIGATLIADETAPEQTTLHRFREIRQEVRGLYASWWANFLPPAGALGMGGASAEALAEFVLEIYDGYSLALAAGDASPAHLALFEHALHVMVDTIGQGSRAERSV